MPIILPSVQVDIYTLVWSIIDIVIILISVLYFASLQFWKLKSEPWWVKALTIYPVVLLASMAQMCLVDMTAHFQGSTVPMVILCFFFGTQIVLGNMGAWEFEEAHGGPATSA
jgi:hypothetical protein